MSFKGESWGVVNVRENFDVLYGRGYVVFKSIYDFLYLLGCMKCSSCIFNFF